MTTYLVTGAAGFIGTNFVRHVLRVEPDADVLIVDNLGFASHRANLEGLGERVSFELADIADEEHMRSIYSEYEPRFVVNFAAESHNDRAIVGPTAFMRSNAMGAQTMVECSRLAGVDRHVHVSTIEVYGELPPGVEAFDESSPLNAKTPYSAAKAAGDQIVRSYMQTYPDMSIVMTHCANNYGPYQLPEKLIPLAVTNLLQGKKVALYGDGLQMRDWLHVEDHCRAIHQLVHADLPPIPPTAAYRPEELPIYDISVGDELTNREIIAMVVDALGRDFDESVEFVGDRPNHDRRYLIDAAKLRRELSFEPTIALGTGIEHTVKWYVDNEDWWRAAFAEKGDLVFDWDAHAKRP